MHPELRLNPACRDREEQSTDDSGEQQQSDETATPQNEEGRYSSNADCRGEDYPPFEIVRHLSRFLEIAPGGDGACSPLDSLIYVASHRITGLLGCGALDAPQVGREVRAVFAPRVRSKDFNDRVAVFGPPLSG